MSRASEETQPPNLYSHRVPGGRESVSAWGSANGGLSQGFYKALQEPQTGLQGPSKAEDWKEHKDIRIPWKSICVLS